MRIRNDNKLMGEIHFLPSRFSNINDLGNPVKCAASGNKEEQRGTKRNNEEQRGTMRNNEEQRGTTRNKRKVSVQKGLEKSGSK